MKPSEEPGEDCVLKVKSEKTVSVEIPDFTKKIDDVENKKKPIHGPKFKVGKKDFHIKIYPEDNREGSTHIAVYLCNPILNKEKIKASCTLKHESGVMKVFENREIEAGSGRGASEFLSHVAYKKWAEDHGDVFKVEAEITLHVQEGNPEPEWERQPAPKFDLLAEVSSLAINNNDRLFTDFTILSQAGKKFPCHRVILASQSPVMLAMMSNDMKEKEESEVTVKKSDEVVAHFVEYFYSRKVPRKALEANLASFFDLAGMYDLAPLKLLTEQAAIGMLSGDTMVDLFVLGDLHSAASLKTEAEAFIKRNRKELKEIDLSSYPHTVVTDLVRLLI